LFDELNRELKSSSVHVIEPLSADPKDNENLDALLPTPLTTTGANNSSAYNFRHAPTTTPWFQSNENSKRRNNSEGNNGEGADQTVYEELLKSIKLLVGKQEDIEAQNVMVAEWRLVAQVVDKVLFWVFTTVTIVSSLLFLIVLPMYKRSWYGPSPPNATTEGLGQNDT